MEIPEPAYPPNGVAGVLVVGDAIFDAFECGRNWSLTSFLGNPCLPLRRTFTGAVGLEQGAGGPAGGAQVSPNWRGQCPRSHPYRIPKINYLIRHPNTDGKVSNPLMVSAGADSWENYTSMHGDYFAANQDVFNNTLIDLCLRNAPDSVTVVDPRCGEEP